MKRTFTSIFTLALLFMTSAGYAQVYCTTGLATNGCTSNDFIQSFSTTGGITNITNNNTGCSNAGPDGYTYFSTMTHSTIQGTVVNFSLTNNPTWPQGYKIWVDYNNNGSFMDPGEQVYASAATIAGGA